MWGWGPQNIFPLWKGFDVVKRGPSVLGPTAILLLIPFEREDLAFEFLKVIQGESLEGREFRVLLLLLPTATTTTT